MLVGAGASDASVVVAVITTIGGVVMASIAAWSAVMVARATSTQAGKVAGLEHDNAELKQRVHELEEGADQ